MRYRPLGQSGLLVSVVGLGCNNFGSRLDVDGTRAVVDAAIDAGITLFDTSDTYGGHGGSERALGEVLGSRRDQIVLATKFGGKGVDMGYGPAAGAKGGRSYIRRAVTESLRRLRTDYIDLYQQHVPDPVTPVEETLAALHELVAEGKVRYIGHSNFSGWQLADAAHLAARNGHTPFISAQNHWSLLERQAEAEVVPAARHFGLGVLPYFPLANGLLTGKVRQGQAIPAGTRLAARQGYVTEEKLAKVEALISWAQEHGVTLLETAIGALAAQPGCSSVIAGATSAEQVKANTAAAEWIPTAAELAEIDAIVPPPAGPLATGPSHCALATGALTVCYGRLVQGRGFRAEHGRIRDLGGIAALLVPAYDADHHALPGSPADLAQERPAAGPIREASAVELELVGHRLAEPVLAGDGLVRGVRVSDRLHQLAAGRCAGG
jgi:aryl-alcohol dehydrogenase-like predicted oxidoreductase